MAPWSPADLLPAVEVALLAAVLALLLHRFFDRLPAAVVAVFAFVVTLSFAPVLAGGRLLLPLDSLRGEAPFTLLAPSEPHGNVLQGDLLQLVAPALAEVRRALADGRWPLWSPRVGAGMPLLADPQAQALQPLAWAGLPLGAARGAGVTAALRVWVALIFTFLLLRRQALGAGAAAVGGLAWGLGGFLMLWLGWPLANVAALLPAALYAAARLADRGGRRDVALAAAVLAVLATAGHPETVAYAAAVTGVFFVHRLRGSPAGETGAPARRRAAVAAGALALALGVAAPTLLPTAAYLPQTLRATRLASPPPALADGGQRLAERLVPLVAPNSFGNDRYAAYWGNANVNEDASGFVGGAALLAALLAVAGLGRRDRFPQERLMAALAGVCLVVVALPPGVAALLARLPGGSASDYHHRLLLPLGLAVTFLAACEVERWRRGQGNRWLAAAVAVALAAIAVGAYLAFPDPADPDRLDVLRRGWVHWHLRFYAAAALVLVVARGRRWLPVALAPLVAAELLLAHLPANPPMPPRLAFPRPEPIVFLQDRLVGAEGHRVSGLDNALSPHLGALYGLADPRVRGPMAPAAYLAALAPVTTAWRGEFAELGRPAAPLYDLLGVRYLLALPSPVPGGAPPAPGLDLALRHPAADIWERRAPLPRLFLPRAAVAQPADWRERLAAVEDFAAEALVEALPAGGGWRAAQPEAGGIEILGLGAARVRARSRAPEARLLVASIYQDGGWRLLLDGRRRPTTRADGPFLAAWLPPGEHALELLYRPPAFVLGCLAAALALALGTAWLLPPPAPPRSRSP